MKWTNSAEFVEFTEFYGERGEGGGGGGGGGGVTEDRTGHRLNEYAECIVPV